MLDYMSELNKAKRLVSEETIIKLIVFPADCSCYFIFTMNSYIYELD